MVTVMSFFSYWFLVSVAWTYRVQLVIVIGDKAELMTGRRGFLDWFRGRHAGFGNAHEDG